MTASARALRDYGKLFALGHLVLVVSCASAPRARNAVVASADENGWVPLYPLDSAIAPGTFLTLEGGHEKFFGTLKTCGIERVPGTSPSSVEGSSGLASISVRSSRTRERNDSSRMSFMIDGRRGGSFVIKGLTRLYIDGVELLGSIPDNLRAAAGKSRDCEHLLTPNVLFVYETWTADTVVSRLERRTEIAVSGIVLDSARAIKSDSSALNSTARRGVGYNARVIVKRSNGDIVFASVSIGELQRCRVASKNAAVSFVLVDDRPTAMSAVCSASRLRSLSAVRATVGVELAETRSAASGIRPLTIATSSTLTALESGRAELGISGSWARRGIVGTSDAYEDMLVGSARPSIRLAPSAPSLVGIVGVYVAMRRGIAPGSTDSHSGAALGLGLVQPFSSLSIPIALELDVVTLDGRGSAIRAGVGLWRSLK